MIQKLQQAKQFLEKIKPEDKITIISHEDPDGFTSGILLFNYLENKQCLHKKIFFLALEKDMLKPLKENLQNTDIIIISDISPEFISKDLEELKNKKILYIDHHQKYVKIPEQILEVRTKSEIPCGRTAYELTRDQISKDKEWVALLGILTDVGFKEPENIKLAQPLLEKFNLTLEQAVNYECEVGYFLSYFKKDLDKAFERLYKINNLQEIKRLEEFTNPVKEEIKKWVKNFEKEKEKIGSVNFYCLKPFYPVKGAIINQISLKNPEEIFVFASLKEDKITISARSQKSDVDMAQLLRKATKDFKYSLAGGHFHASGAKIQKQDLEKFKENLKDVLVG